MEVKVVRRCLSCGAPLQSEEPEKPGYIDKDVYSRRGPDDVVYCNECYEKLRFSSSPALVKTTDPDFLTMLKDARASDSLIVYVIDLFSFECSFVEEVTSLIRGLPILVIANKRDLLPRDADDRAIASYVASRFKKEGLAVNDEDVVLTSLSTFSDVSEAMGLLEKKRRRHDAYLIGAKLSGKSLFVSSFIRLYSNPSKKAISVSEYPGTDLPVMAIPLDSSSCLYDTPGTGIENSYVSQLEPASLSLVVPFAPIKARKGETKAGDVIMLGGLAFLETMEGEASYEAYFAPKLVVKKDGRKKGGFDIDYLLRKAAPAPRSTLLSEGKDFDAFELSFAKEKHVDLGIAGLGWWHLSFKGPTSFRLYLKKGVGIYVSDLPKVASGKKEKA